MMNQIIKYADSMAEQAERYVVAANNMIQVECDFGTPDQVDAAGKALTECEEYLERSISEYRRVVVEANDDT